MTPGPVPIPTQSKDIIVTQGTKKQQANTGQ